MAVGTGTTEIADSEDEPLTSSPVAVSDAAADKLSATACQDAQAMACPHQETTGSIADEASNRTDGLGVDQERLLSNIKTTHPDHIDLQSAPQPKTNVSSTCIADQVHADAPPTQLSVAAVRASHQTSSIDADRADGETNTAQDLEHVPAAGVTTQHYEPKPSSTDTQTDAEDCEQDKCQPVSRESLPSSPVHVRVEQVRSSQDEADGNHVTVLDPGSNDYAQLDSDQSESCQDGAFMNCVTKIEVANSEAFAGLSQHDVAQNTSVEPLASITTSNMDTSRVVLHSEDVSESMDLDQAPATIDLATIHPESAEDTRDTAVTKTDLRELDQAIIQNDVSAAAPVLLSGAEPTSSTCTYSLGLDDAGNSLSISADPSKATDVHEPHVGEQANNNTTHELEAQDLTTNANPLDQAPAAQPAERCLEQEQVHAGEESSVGTEATQTPEQQAPSGTVLVHSNCENDTRNRSDSNAMPLAPATQIQSQSTSSQASEPASPQPAVRLTTQEITLVELKAQKAALLASLGALPAIQVLIEESQISDVDMSDDDGKPTDTDITTAANKMVKEHIKLLHEYNELKDVGQGLMGLIADQRGVRIVEVQDEFGIDAND